MRGFRKFRTICLLSRWKYCAGVVGCVTNMFTVSPSTPSSTLSHIWGKKWKKGANVQIISFNHKDPGCPKGNMSVSDNFQTVSSAQVCTYPVISFPKCTFLFASHAIFNLPAIYFCILIFIKSFFCIFIYQYNLASIYYSVYLSTDLSSSCVFYRRRCQND